MLGILLSVPVLIVLTMLQTTVVKTLPLLRGTADLILLAIAVWALQERVRSSFEWAVLGGLIIGFLSGGPLIAYLAGYVGVAFIARFLRRRVWQTPILAMILTTFVGTLLVRGLEMGMLIFQGDPLPVLDSINLVILPSALLNLLLLLPMYALVSDLARWVYPEEVEV